RALNSRDGIRNGLSAVNSSPRGCRRSENSVRLYGRRQGSAEHSSRERNRIALAFHRLEGLGGDVAPELTVALELILSVELVAGRLVGKVGVAGFVLQHRGVLAAGHRRLEVNKDAVGRAAAVNDPSDGMPPEAPEGVPFAPDGADVDEDLRAEIHIAHADQRSQT